ncbi:hypothetical protein MVLG_06671 [Microbotryum lychnidis-dioicae p1A1 Lamole]|uniref:Uncharacterized protein n=1 Tax=Microbotryum lychnidis-dioicae (strain p1A1 Lamole / MvSl-1064) TaxID=683840 RepID=U5HI02_USTV1|nr:hypothetical protein MVLG_06671 [Microbotryum lychnidis-dioicae p1A1 Lamole]|eukprot:KDE02813.1 hypothetical protein MVLG_06671 [Microbotryum lychnidis-dioicae p1A1 Lamole]
MSKPRGESPRYQRSVSIEGPISAAAPSRSNGAWGGAEEAGDDDARPPLASSRTTTMTGSVTYPPTRDGECVISFDGREVQRKDSVWSVSMQSQFDGDHVSSVDDDSDEDDEDGVNDRSELFPINNKGRIVKSERRNSREGPWRIESRESRTRPEDGWIVGGRRWRGAAPAVAGLVVLILLLLLTSMKVMDETYIREKIEGREGSKVVDSAELGPPRPALGTKVKLDSDPEGEYIAPSGPKLQEAVGTEPKFLVMDGDDARNFYDLRVIIETVLNLATISSRIPVIPGHVWMRSCRVKSKDCTQNSLDHREESWRGPEGWKIGIEHLIDIPHLRKIYGLVLTQSEFSTLFNVTPEMTLWSQAGIWNMESTALDGLSTSEITSNEWFNDAQFVRLDTNLPSWTEPESDAVIVGLDTARVREIQVDNAGRVWSLERARELLTKTGFKVDGDNHWLEEALRKVEQSRVYSFDERTDQIKIVAQPVVLMADRSRSFSFTDEFLTQPRHRDASLLYVSGPIWNEGRLGGVHFASQETRDQFVNMILEAIRPPKAYIEAGKMVAENMVKVNEGRKWLATEMTSVAAVHMQGSSSAEAKILNQLGLLEKGLAELSAHKAKNLPSKEHLYFLATDETDPATLVTYQRRRAVLLKDLLSEIELKILGWRAMFGDLLKLVEQEVMASSDYFIGCRVSRRTGAVLDARMGPRFEQEEWSWTLDEAA